MARKPLKRKVSFLPNLLTAGNLFAGFYAIVAAVNYRYEKAAVAIIIAAVLDGLDGKVARFTGSTSRFGVEFDSLADLVSFGVAPAMLVYLWALQPYGRIGWVAAFLMVSCGALRLARFNVQSGTVSRRWFTGLPIPMAACSVATTALLVRFFGFEHRFLGPVLILQAYLLAILMVSSLRYRSFKELEMMHNHPFSFLVSTFLLLSIVALHPQITLFTLSVLYVSSGPVEKAYTLIRGGSPTPAAEEYQDEAKT